jgi:hypothetical protein
MLARTRGGMAEGYPSDPEAARQAADNCAELVDTAVEEITAHYAFPEEQHWRRIRTNNPLGLPVTELKRPLVRWYGIKMRIIYTTYQ